MVFGYVRRRHEKRRLACQTQLGHRACAAAGDYDVGDFVGVVHAVDERSLPDVGGRIVAEELLHLLLVVASRLPYYLHGSLAAERHYPRFHHVVEGARAERTADHEHYGQRAVESVIFQCRLAVYGAFGERTAQRVARHHYLFRFEETLHALVGDAYAFGSSADDFVHETCIGVLLLNDGRDAHALCHPDYRCARISAEARHYVGTERLDYGPRTTQRPHHLQRQCEVAQRELALQTRDGQTHYAIAQTGNRLHLHFALRSDEKYLHIVAETAFQRLCDRHRRINMAARSAARKNDPFHVK